MGKHEWMTRRTSRSRYRDLAAGQDPAEAGHRTRWRIGHAAVWVAAGLVVGMVAVLWMGGMFAEPARTVTKIATNQNEPSAPSREETPGNNGGSLPTTGGKGKKMTPAGVKAPASPAPEKLVVHVAGAVKDPGIVTLQQGSRVHEAISAAGGPQDKAQLDAINLAATVQDGQQLYVPTHAEQPVNGTAGPGAAGSGTTAAADGTTIGGAAGAEPLININTADAAELSKLPGVGPVLSERIVDWRAEHGAFESVAELDAVSGIGEKMLATLGELVTV